MPVETTAADADREDHAQHKSPTLDQSREVMASLVTEFAGEGDILEVGCRRGDIGARIRQRLPGARIALADAYQGTLRAAAARVGTDTTTFLLDANRFDIDDAVHGTYDCILLWHLLEHVRDPVGAIQALCRKLKPTGVLILAVPNLSRPEVLVANIFRRDTSDRGHLWGWDPSHFRSFLTRILGLDLVRLTTDSVGLLPGPPGRAIARLVGRRLASVLPWWGFSTIAIVRPGEAFPADEAAFAKAARLTWRAAD